jgi:hypothetical protein
LILPLTPFAPAELFVGWYGWTSRGGGFDTDIEVGLCAALGIGGSSTVDLMEFRLLELKKLGGDFIEKPDRVLPLALLAAAVYPPPPPPPGVPSCGAVRGRSMGASRGRGTLGPGAMLDFCRESFRALDRRISSRTFGPFPATGYDPFTGASDATDFS